jgi:signal transduction histidine kinase
MNAGGVDEQNLPEDRFLARMNLVWAAVFYLALGLSLAATLVDVSGEFYGWPLIVTLVLVGASVALFQRIYWRVTSQPDNWPMPGQLALGYFGGQWLILAALLAHGGSFSGLGFALIGQCCGVLRPRHWVLPLIPLLALIGLSYGWFEAARLSWLGLASFGLMLATWLFVAILIVRLFTQRSQLIAAVRDLQRAKAQLAAAAVQQEELAVLRERTRLAREMHDSIGHALVSVNVKLEVAQRLYWVDLARGDVELELTRTLVRETMADLRRSITDLRTPMSDHHDLVLEVQ